MQKRAYERMPISLKVNFFYGNELSSGTMTNCSENGMFINTSMCLPFGSIFEIIIKLQDELLKVSAHVTRLVKTGDFYDGMGVELFNKHQEYLDFVNRLKTKEFRMPLTISDETLQQTTKCQNNFHCLTDNGSMCLIEKPINAKGLFIKERVNKDENCPYIESSEYAFICNCPTRYEIYMRYNL